MLLSSATVGGDKMKEAFVEGRLAIDCLEIKLTRNGPGDPSSFVCSGSLRVSPQNGVEARLVLARGANEPYNVAALIQEEFALRPGQLFPPSRYFKLEAKDVAGNVWINPSAMVHFDHRPDSFVAKVSCDWVRCEAAVEGSGSATHMVFMDELRFPDNIAQSAVVLERAKKAFNFSPNASAASAGEAGGMLVAFDSREDRPGGKLAELAALNQAQAPLSENFDDRLVEAVRFCSATGAAPAIRETVHKGKKVLEFARHRPANAWMLEPPLQPRGNDADFYRLLERYFQYACANAAGRDYSPLSAKVGGLFTLKGVSLETVALLVSVAVESVLREEAFKDLGKQSATKLDLLKQMIAHIKAAATFEPGFIKRVTDVVGGMKSSRVKDKLHALVEASAIEEKDRTAWNTRNKVAHGSFEIDPAELQEVVDTVYRLSGLVYKLVFLRIGYKGRFTDYGVHGWPPREFTTDLASLCQPSSPAGSAPLPATNTSAPVASGATQAANPSPPAPPSPAA